MERKEEMASLDIRFAVREIRKTISGGMIRKIYQYGNSRTKQLFFEVFVPGKGGLWLYIDRNKLFLTRRRKPAPQEPPSFCMFLRKHIMGKKIRDVRQRGFDRIVEFEIGENTLIAELFRPGNFILCDSTRNIIMPFEVQKWRDREIRPKVPYKYPPKPADPFSIDLSSLHSSMLRSDKSVAAYLASNLGLGRVYANEVLFRSGVDPSKPCSEIRSGEAAAIQNAIHSLDNEFSPSLYRDFVSPFRLRSVNEEPRTFQSFCDALDEYFSEQEVSEAEERIKRELEERKEKVERIAGQQEEAAEKWRRIERESREKAEAIYNYYSIVESALNGIRAARESGLSWEEIKRKIASEPTPEAEAIKEIREGDGIIILDLGGREIEIDISKSVEENAARYYEDAKWARSKLQGTEQAMEEHAKVMEGVRQEEERLAAMSFREILFSREKPPEKREFQEEETEPSGTGREGIEEKVETSETQEIPASVPQRRKRRRWYEKFRWFLSSDGTLVVAGSDANQNELLIKKHTEPGDLVFHADIHGAAFVVAKKPKDSEISDETKKEAAEFAAAHCKAWGRGRGNVDVYAVKPEQVSKAPPSGQSLPKGSFMIYGEREWFRNVELKLAIGVKIDKESGEAQVLSGPVMSLRKHADYFVTIKPGFKKSLELSRTIKNKILIKANPEDKFLIEKIPLDEFQKVVPSGMGEVVEYS